MTYREEQLIVGRIDDLEKRLKEQNDMIERLDMKIHFINNHLGRED